MCLLHGNAIYSTRSLNGKGRRIRGRFETGWWLDLVFEETMEVGADQHESKSVGGVRLYICHQGRLEAQRPT